MMFSERFEKLRKEKKLTQKQVADVLNYGSSAISGYESGRTMPNMCDLIRLALFFEVSVDYLIGISDRRNFGKDENFNKTIELFVDYYYDSNKDIRKSMDAAMIAFIRLCRYTNQK